MSMPSCKVAGRSWKPSRSSCGDAFSGHQDLPRLLFFLGLSGAQIAGVAGQDLSSQLWSTAHSSAPSATLLALNVQTATYCHSRF